MSTADNKVKLQLRPSLAGPGQNILKRTDKNPSPSKLMINHGKPNYTINRSTSSPNNKSLTKDLTTSCLKLPLKSNACAIEMEKVTLKPVESLNISSPSILVVHRPQAPSSFVSPGISSKAAATSFGVKLKQCNKINFQNHNVVTNSNIQNCNIQNIAEEPEFVKRQKQIFEKLQQKEQNQLELTSSRYNLHQNGHSEICNLSRSDEYDSKEIINISHIKVVNNRLENLSSDQVFSKSYNPNYQHKQYLSQNENSICKLPQGAVLDKPVIPGKPPNLQIPTGRIKINQQNYLIKSKNNSINSINETFKTEKTASKNAESQVFETFNDEKILQNLSGTTFDEKTLSLSKDLLTKLSFYPNTAKVKKALSNGNGLINYEDEDDEGLKEFIANENSSKLAECIEQSKFDIKTGEQNLSLSNDVTMK